ncbi:MAG: YIP1 family protein [Methanomicrobiales archaeon]|nr:YIP1 family protein [Methanomicrobiales archaeon]
MELRDLLFVPDRFFRENNNISGLAIPVLLVGIVGVLSAISAYFVTQVTIQAILPALPSGTSQYMTIAMSFAVIGGMLGAYILWLVATVVFFGLSALFKGSGDLRKGFEYIGYGFLPQIFGGVINLYLYYEFATTVNIPRITDPTLINEVTRSLMSNQYIALATLVGILFLLWSANLWIFGLKYARNLETRDAAICVIVPVGIYVLYTVFSTGILGGLFA